MSMPFTPSPFVAAVTAAHATNASHLCVGLDPEPEALPPHLPAGPEGIIAFCRSIIEATADLVCAYKPNLAFFERFGAAGWRALEEVLAAVPVDIPVIADAKRGDIGNTSRAYAEAIFDRLAAAACTVSPYLGVDAAAPFLDHPGGYTFVLCRTSNPGAGALQDLLVDGLPLYARVIGLFEPWLATQRAGLVIGARQHEAFARAAHMAPSALILVPGIGAQGGTVHDLSGALSPDQAASVVVSVSRAVIHAGNDRDFAQAARRAALDLRAQFQNVLAHTAEDA